ncbi:MAG TPA: hypothetical protein VNS32_15795 [Flavisolibacter sp.]|nr:hypothetical protein [Flavisolibacter sp.]
MKRIISIIILLFCIKYATATDFENAALGIRFEYPQTWKSVPVLEANQGVSLFEASRNDHEKDIMNLIVFPTIDRKVEAGGLECWAGEMAEGFHSKKKDILASRIVKLGSEEWYSMTLKFKDRQVYVFQTITSGYSYTFTFLVDPTEKGLDSEFEQITGSVQLTQPRNVAVVKDHFDHLERDANTGMLIPEGFQFVKSIERKGMAPYAYSLYSGLLQENNADYVLVARNMTQQLFCLNVKLNNQQVNEATASLLSKFVGNKFKQDGTSYEEVSVGPWEQSPKKVFMHKFRLKKDKTHTTHYIFYVSRENKTDIIKFQTSTYLEIELESLFFLLMKKELE